MYIAPNSTMKFYSDVPIVTGRQIAFSTKANQTAYFETKRVFTYTPTTYQRLDVPMRVDIPLPTAMRCNYVSFINPDFENITWYARIVSADYINNDCTQFTFALDLFQTFMNDIDFDNCVIDREQLSVSDYDKSVANPYDYDIIELQTEEALPVPDAAYDYPNLIGQKDNTGSKRTFLPGGWEDDANEKLAEKTMMYTLVMSCPFGGFTYTPSANMSKEVNLPYGLSVDIPTIFDDYDGTFPVNVAEGMLMNAGFHNAVRQRLYDNHPYLPIGNNLVTLNNIIDGTKKTSGNATAVCGCSWVCWPYSSGNTGAKTSYDAGFGCFGFNMNNINNQTLILATSDYKKMSSILDAITEQDSVSSIIGMYVLPLSFLVTVHASNMDRILTTNYETLNQQQDNYPDGITLADNAVTVFKEEVHPLNFSQVKNKKLLTFPYQYIKVTDPAGLIKEYKFEDFTEFQNISGNTSESDFTARFTLLGDMTGTPKVEMYPYLYKMYQKGTSAPYMSFRKKLNVDERMEFTDFPQQAFMTDAFTAYMANVYAQNVMQESNNKLFSSYSGASGVISNLKKSMGNAIDQKSGVIGALNDFFGSSSGSIPMGMPSTSEYSYVNGTTIRSGAANHAGTRYASAAMTGTRLDAASALPMAGQALNYGANLGQNIVGTFSGAGKAGRALEAEQIRLSADNQIADMRIRESAIAWGNGEFQVSPYLERTKGAFRMNDYHAGTGSGILPYFLGGFKYTFDVMKLKPEFIKKYDEFFTNFGYASSRVGIPHIQTYLQGTKTGNAPKFLQNADGYYVTYIKTMNCKINHYNTMVSSFLEGLFDGGIQLIDGDTLL